MEQIKFSDGVLKEIFKMESNTFMKPATLSVSFLNEDILKLEELFKDSDKTETIYLCDSSGGTMAVFNGYTELSSITKNVSQIIRYTEEELGEDGNAIKESEPIYGDIITVHMRQADLKQQLQALNAKNTELEKMLSSLNETQAIQDGAILELAQIVG